MVCFNDLWECSSWNLGKLIDPNLTWKNIFQPGWFFATNLVSTDDGQLSYLGILYKAGHELEDHPRTDVSGSLLGLVSLLRIGLWDPFQMALTAYKWGFTNHLLSGMILQVTCTYDHWKVEYISRTSRPNKEVISFSLQFQGMSEWYV